MLSFIMWTVQNKFWIGLVNMLVCCTYSLGELPFASSPPSQASLKQDLPLPGFALAIIWKILHTGEIAQKVSEISKFNLWGEIYLFRKMF